MMAAEINELREIRLALDLNQTEMGKALGVKQSGYQRWEDNPDKPAALSALERAKSLYQERKGKPWGESRVRIGDEQVAEALPRYPKLTPAIAPRHVEQGYILLREALDLHGATPEDFTRPRLGRVLGLAARAVADAPDFEAARADVIREIELLLELVK